MNFPMMSSAQGYGVFVAHLATERLGLREPKMMRI
jgi:hypothetical protein